MNDMKKMIAGIALLVQSITMFILFLVQKRERRGLAVAFLGISCASGLVGAKLIADASEDEEDEDLFDIEFDDLDETADADEGLDIDPVELKGDLEHGTDDEAQSI